MSRLSPVFPEGDVLGAAFPVAQSVFSGPLHLLLTLIESQALDISEISLIAVTSDYLDAIRDMEDLPAPSACAFIDVTSRLIALKARHLWPNLPVGPEEEEDTVSLVEQLEQLKAYGNIIEDLHLRQHDQTRTYRRHVALPVAPAQGNGTFESTSRLTRSLHSLLQALPRVKPATLIQLPLFSVEDVISRIQGTLQTWRDLPSVQRLSFFSLLRPRSSRSEVVLTFLALLEMVRNRELTASQESPFGDITIHPHTSDETPAT